jgi:hypothetical protein
MQWITKSRMNGSVFTAALWLASQQTASAQTLLAQTGTAKTAVGWAIVLLCIGLGLLVVCRPNIRNPLEKKKAKAKK